jgi:hypothetical protein
MYQNKRRRREFQTDEHSAQPLREGDLAKPDSRVRMHRREGYSPLRVQKQVKTWYKSEAIMRKAGTPHISCNTVDVSSDGRQARSVEDELCHASGTGSVPGMPSCRMAIEKVLYHEVMIIRCVSDYCMATTFALCL